MKDVAFNHLRMPFLKVLAKLICHNLRLIHEQEELGIAAVFFKDEAPKATGQVIRVEPQPVKPELQIAVAEVNYYDDFRFSD